ncbi:TasA family protein [Nocardioides sp.]|uniref:TasA family protein n=1 Tax=Nocardioides sp. TaxID=35761 RepID=UPI003514D504
MPEHRAPRRRDASHRAPRRRRPPLLRAGGAVAAAAIVGVGSLGTYAYWTDAAAVTSGTLTSGTLDLKVEGQQGTPTAATWPALAITDLAPGESVAATLTLANAGTTPFTFSVTGTLTGTAQPYLQVRVVRAGTAANSGSTYPRTGSCSGGTETYALASLSAGATVVASSPALAAAASTTLCVIAALPSGTGNAAQGTSATLTLTAQATQQ